MTRSVILALLLCPIISFAQYDFSPKNHVNDARYGAKLYSLSNSFHTSTNLIHENADNDYTNSKRKSIEEMKLGKSSWFGRKLFDENLVQLKGENYDLRIDPLVNFQFGAESGNSQLLFVNTRGFMLQGRLGNKLTFSSSFTENQAIMPTYVADFVREWDVVPGQGFFREFGDTGFDYSMASGEISYMPDDIFTFSLGQGRNFFGEGYRSMLLSDAAFNYPFLRIETKFWNIKYVNLWGQLYDVRRDVAPNNIFNKKYFASHYLSINITKRWNLSFFEAIILSDTAQQRGIDVSFFNPIIFYRPVEFAVGSRSGNALLGAASSYKILDGLQVYTQFVLDEFTSSQFFSSNGYWGNKFGFQLGAKYHNAFGIEGLFARLEYNTATPYTYSHLEPLGNYGHYSQSLAHPWGANFQEYLLHLQYVHKRWEFEMRLHYGKIGLDSGNANWGANIYLPYNTRESDFGNSTGQGVDGTLTFTSLRAAWLVNPTTGLKLEAGARLRNLSSDISNTLPVTSNQSSYYYFGLRTEMFNRYYDF